METNFENKCAYCRFCNIEDKFGYVCHNEKSKSYGEIFDYENLQNQTCENFSAYNFKMTLREAVNKILLLSDDSLATYYDRKLPSKDKSFAYVVHSFKSNSDLEDWKEAFKVLIRESYLITEKENKKEKQ